MKISGAGCVITGASSGIGAALAHQVVRRGGRAALLSRNLKTLTTLAERLGEAYPTGPPPLPIRCDVTDRESVRRAVAASIEGLETIDVWVNNAGISVYGALEHTSETDLRELLDVNFIGPALAMLEVLPHMKTRGRGCLVNVASLAAVHGVPYLAGYGASKAALAAFSQSLRAELAGSGIRVTVVYPGYTRTPLFQNEKKTGGARRPDHRYASAETVAARVIEAVENERDEVVLTAEGSALATAKNLFPRLVSLAMARIAARLRVAEVKSHAQT